MLQLDQAVVEFIINAELSKMPTSGRVMLAMARRFARNLAIPVQQRPRFTRTEWLRHFLKRYNLHRKRAHGKIASVDFEEAKKQLVHLRERIGQFHPSNVYNMDETALYYKSVPRTSIALNEAPAHKQDKSRVTLVVGTNADGTDKLPLVVLGKAEKPRWLSKKPDAVQYVGTSKGWMTVSVYQEWLRKLDERENRRILFLVDNAPTHIHRDVNLKNVAVMKFPPNTTALLQPMDQGVIAYLMHEFMNKKTDAAVERFLEDEKKPFQASLLQGIKWCEESWSSVPAEVIQNCWRHAGLLVDRSSLKCILHS